MSRRTDDQKIRVSPEQAHEKLFRFSRAGDLLGHFCTEMKNFRQANLSGV